MKKTSKYSRKRLQKPEPPRTSWQNSPAIAQ